MRAYIWAVAILSLAGAGLGIGCTGATADTLEWALVQAYQNNPSLNAQRAVLRATDEAVPQALSGYRPKLSVTALGGANYTNSTAQFPLSTGGPISNIQYTEQFLSRSVGATGTYTVFNGFQTANRTRQAESQVDGARETLRVTEQQVLLDAATAYMNLLRDQAILDLNRRNVEVLTEQLKQTRDRFNVGEVTRTDVAQAESRLAAGRSALLGAQSNYVTSQANYRRVIGVDPGRLAPGTPVDRLSPGTLPRAVAEGQAQSPSVLASAYGVDVAALAVGDHHEPGLAAGGDDVAERRDAGCAEALEAGELRLDGDTCRPGSGDQRKAVCAHGARSALGRRPFAGEGRLSHRPEAQRIGVEAEHDLGLAPRDERCEAVGKGSHRHDQQRYAHAAVAPALAPDRARVLRHGGPPGPVELPRLCGGGSRRRAVSRDQPVLGPASAEPGQSSVPGLTRPPGSMWIRTSAPSRR